MQRRLVKISNRPSLLNRACTGSLEVFTLMSEQEFNEAKKEKPWLHFEWSDEDINTMFVGQDEVVETVLEDATLNRFTLPVLEEKQ